MSELVKELGLSFVSLSLGGCLYACEKTKVVGTFLVFFGAQTGMNIYMKAVFSKVTVSEELELYGVPCSFLITAGQQLGSFCLFWIGLVIAKILGYDYSPKVLETRFEWFAVILFSFSFTLNIALNNFSLSLITLAVNLIIRSCLPLSTFMSQQVSARCTGQEPKPIKALEIGLMLLGVICAGIAVVAKIEGSGKGSAESKSMVFGTIVCVISLFSGSINLALAGVLGTSVKMNSLDAVVYNAIPATLFLLGPIFFYKHPIGWTGYEDKHVTDWEVFQTAWSHNKGAVGFAALSSALSLAYNTLQYGIVMCMTATHVAFAGNFNKAATIPLALLVGLEKLPAGKWGVIMLLACFGSIGAFAAYNAVTQGAGGHHGHVAKDKEAKSLQEEEEEEEEEDEDDADEEEDESSDERGCMKC